MDFNSLSDTELLAKLKKRRMDLAKHEVMQKGLKVTLNSAYGMIGYQGSRYYDLRIAEGITVSGQLSIRWIERKVNEYLNKILGTTGLTFVIAGDTDSIYMSLQPMVDKFAPNATDEKVVKFLDKVCARKLEPFINKSYQELAIYVNAFQQKMSMKREVIADVGIWRAKKNYALHVHNSEGVQYREPKIKIVGMESTRSSIPEICRNAFKDALKVIMTSSEEDAQKHVKDFRNKFETSGVEAISFPRGVNDLDKWMVGPEQLFIKGTPIHVKASITYNRLLVALGLTKKYRMIKNGDKIRFVYMKPTNPTGNNAIAYPDILPPEFELDEYIHVGLQFEKSFRSPVKTIFDVIGWNVEKVNTIDEFFA